MSVARQRVYLLAVLGLGLAIRLPFLSLDPKVSGDIGILVGWAQHLASGGLAELLADQPRAVLYPPLAMLDIWLAGALGPAIAIIKTAPVLADIGLALFIWLMLSGRGARARLAGAAAICFNPALWYLSAIWGQIDSVYVLLLVTSIAALADRRYSTSWVAWALGVTWKLQALVIGPILLTVTLASSGARGLARGLAAGITVLLLTTATLLVFLGGDAAEYLGRLWPTRGPVVISAFNVWYAASPLVGRAPDWMNDFLEGGAWLIGWLLVAVVAAVSMRALWRLRSRYVLALAAATLSLAPFVLLTAMHERYLLAAIPFLLLVAFGWGGSRLDRTGLVAFVAISASQMFNLVAVASFAPDLWLNVFATTEGLAQPLRYTGYVVALVNLAVLSWGIVRLCRVAGDQRTGPVRDRFWR